MEMTKNQIVESLINHPSTNYNQKDRERLLSKGHKDLKEIHGIADGDELEAQLDEVENERIERNS